MAARAASWGLELPTRGQAPAPPLSDASTPPTSENKADTRSKEKRKSLNLESEARSLVETDPNGIRSGRTSLYLEVGKQR